MDTRNNILEKLESLGLSSAESWIYYELIRRGPMTHLQLSRLTGISRTKIYRIAEQLESRSLITRKIDDQGAALIAGNHESLEIELATRVEQIETQQEAYEALRPLLDELSSEGMSPLKFSLRTYDGVTGFKQMLWNELKAKGELLAFGDGVLEDLIGSCTWAEKYRERIVTKNYSVREIANSPSIPTENRAFKKKISARQISEDKLPLRHQVIVYNGTVSIYCWRDGQKTGLEIINSAFAETMRAVFEKYWKEASSIPQVTE